MIEDFWVGDCFQDITIFFDVQCCRLINSKAEREFNKRIISSLAEGRFVTCSSADKSLLEVFGVKNAMIFLSSKHLQMMNSIARIISRKNVLMKTVSILCER